MDIQALESLETKRAWPEIEKYLGSKTSKTPEVLKFASAYYVRRGRAETSLAYYAEYVNSTTSQARDISATRFAIECADRIGRHDLVREYFTSLNKLDRENLDGEVLARVANAFIVAGQLDEAEKILRFVRHSRGAPQLKDFSTLIKDTFGSVTEARKFAEKTRPETLGESFKAALAFMALGDYKKAEQVLLTFKTRIAA